MTLKPHRGTLLAIMVFLSLYSSVLVTFAITYLSNHDCCATTTEDYCVPCMIVTKLRDSFQQLGAVSQASVAPVILAFLLLAMIVEGKGRYSQSLIELKVRMNN